MRLCQAASWHCSKAEYIHLSESLKYVFIQPELTNLWGLQLWVFKSLIWVHKGSLCHLYCKQQYIRRILLIIEQTHGLLRAPPTTHKNPYLRPSKSLQGVGYGTAKIPQMEGQLKSGVTRAERRPGRAGEAWGNQGSGQKPQLGTWIKMSTPRARNNKTALNSGRDYRRGGGTNMKGDCWNWQRDWWRSD